MASTFADACRSRSGVSAPLVTTALASLLLGPGCRTAPVHNLAQVPLPASSSRAPDETKEILILGAQRCGWRLREAGPDRLRGEKIVGQHRALVEVSYDTNGYGITLLEADNLLYDGQKIHKTYNLWVEQLQKCIDDELRFRS